MEDVYVYPVDLPPKIKAFSTPCPDGFTVYINQNLDQRHQFSAYQHELEHIRSNDFEKQNVQAVEYAAHNKEGGM